MNLPCSSVTTVLPISFTQTDTEEAGLPSVVLTSPTMVPEAISDLVFILCVTVKSFCDCAFKLIIITIMATNLLILNIFAKEEFVDRQVMPDRENPFTEKGKILGLAGYGLNGR